MTYTGYSLQPSVSIHERNEKYVVKERSATQTLAHPVSSGVGQNGLCHSITVFLFTQLLGSRLDGYGQGQATTMTHHPVNTRHIR